MAGDKTQLLIRDQYAKLAAVELAARLVARYEMREPGPVAIRVEAVGIESWDDIHELWNGNPQTYWQVKRQRTPYEEQTFAKLIRDSGPIDGKDGTSCRVAFHDWTSVAVGKKEHELRVLDEMCGDLRRAGVDTGLFFQGLTAAKREWLGLISGWMGSPTGDYASALAVLRKLHLQALGSEEEIKRRCRESLASAYENADALLDSLIAYFDANPTGIVNITYGVLAEQVLRPKGQRRPAVRHWLTFRRNPSNLQLQVAGSLAPTALPARLRTGGSIDLVSCGPNPVTDNLCRQLLRLSLHHHTLVRLEVENAAGWGNGAARLYGGTLGIGKDSDPELTVREAFSGSTEDLASMPIDGAALGQSLELEVGTATWDSVVGSVTLALDDPQLMDLGAVEPALLATMKSLWTSWLGELNTHDARVRLTKSLLSTSHDLANGQFDARIRFGARTVHLVSRGLLAGLALAAAFPGSTIILEPESAFNIRVPGLVEVHVLALAQAWCGVQMRPVAIDSPTASFLMTGEAAPLLSFSRTSAEDLFDVLKGAAVPFHRAGDGADSLMQVGAPPPIITLDLAFIGALAKGAEAVRVHVGNLVGRSKAQPGRVAEEIAAGKS